MSPCCRASASSQFNIGEISNIAMIWTIVCVMSTLVSVADQSLISNGSRPIITSLHRQIQYNENMVFF